MGLFTNAARRGARRGRGGFVAVLAALLLLAGCAASSLHRDGLRLIESGQGLEGLALLKRARELEPTDASYRITYLRELNQWLQAQAARAEALRNRGDHDGATALYQQMLQWDPSNVAAQRGLLEVQRHRERGTQYAQAEAALKRGDLPEARRIAGELAHSDTADLRAAQLVRRVEEQIEQRRREAASQRVGASPLAQPVSLQFRESPLKMVLEALSRSSGVNIIVDKDVRPDLRTTIFVSNVSLQEAIDLIAVQNQLARRVMSPQSILLYPATAAKQREYQELHLRTFHLSNADAKHVQNVLRTLLKVRDIVIDERTNSIILREPMETLQVAERIIASQEAVEPEVMLEVDVLEVSRERLRTLGIRWPDSVSVAVPLDASQTTTVGALRGLSSNDLVVSPLGVGINLRLQDSNANLLASPRLRARSREKARILIGDKVPVITNTVTPVTTGSPVVTGSVQYLDVGLKLEVEPQVYAESEVGIRVNLEVSTLVREIPGPNGSLAYQIGTRNLQTALRLRDGETQVLAGLISDNDRNIGNRVPGIGQLPVLSRIFGSDDENRAKSEIVLSITPHVVRHRVTEPASSEIPTGTEASVRGAGAAADAAAPAAAPRAPGAAAPGTPVPPATAPRGAAPAAGGAPAGGAPYSVPAGTTTPRPAPQPVAPGATTPSPSLPPPMPSPAAPDPIVPSAPPPPPAPGAPE